MKFKEHAAVDMLSHVFSVHIGEDDLAQVTRSEREFRGFAWTVMNRLAMMITAYYFKRHKTTFDEFLSSQECKNMIAAHIADKIKFDYQI